MSAPAGASRPKAVLIDLDGTLLDTAADLAAAANGMLAGLGLPPCSVEQVGTYVGKGIERLVERVLTGSLEGRIEGPRRDEQLLPALRLFEACYAEYSGRHATLYPGVDAGLRAFAAAGLPMACVTNKPRAHALPLLEQFALRPYFQAVVGGDDVPRKKPAPDALLAASRALGIPASAALMIGDSANDVAAARAADCPVWCVGYGYREGLPVEALGADRICRDLIEASRLALGGVHAKAH
jgi:phosphoglycolate phosphatase